MPRRNCKVNFTFLFSCNLAYAVTFFISFNKVSLLSLGINSHIDLYKALYKKTLTISRLLKSLNIFIHVLEKNIKDYSLLSATLQKAMEFGAGELNKHMGKEAVLGWELWLSRNTINQNS